MTISAFRRLLTALNLCSDIVIAWHSHLKLLAPVLELVPSWIEVVTEEATSQLIP